MVDIQSMQDTRQIAIQKVGIKSLRYPICVRDKQKGRQHTTASINLYADLPHNCRGTHMSRFAAVIERHKTDLSFHGFLAMLSDLRGDLSVDTVFGEINFPYFIEKLAPISLQPSTLSYDCSFYGAVGKNCKEFKVIARIPVQTICPCSKAISERGAHNQRGLVTVTIEDFSFFWLEDVIELVESSASAQLYTLLKREDEKFITESAYDNPRFVEDLVREAGLKLRNTIPSGTFTIEAENYESIHSHSAYALVSCKNGSF